jgi:hypothetical protein
MLQKENLLFLAVPLHENKAPGEDLDVFNQLYIGFLQ